MSSSSPAPLPDTSGGDSSSSAAAAAANSNFTLLYIIIAVLVGVVLYLAIGYGRSVLSEWRGRQQLNGGGARPPASSPHGLSVDDIAALPTFTYRAAAAAAGRAGPPTPSPPPPPPRGKRRSGSKGRAPAVECVVCLQELEDGDVVRVLPACRHFFHGGCIDAWLRAHSSCPVCRAYPEALDRARPALSPPLPQLRPCGGGGGGGGGSGVSSQAESPSPLMSNSASPAAPMAGGDYILSRSPSQTPLTLGRSMVDDRISSSPAAASSPEMTEILVVRSTSPSPIRAFFRQSTTTTTRCVGVLERRTDGEDDESLSKLPSPLPH